jgi:hypothetical protein
MTQPARHAAGDAAFTFFWSLPRWLTGKSFPAIVNKNNSRARKNKKMKNCQKYKNTEADMKKIFRHILLSITGIIIIITQGGSGM